MSIDWGFNFRGTFAYVTDGANESAVLAEAYPHVYSNGATAGWSVGTASALDRSASVDRRIAGINYSASANLTFRIDLPSTGDYNIWLGYGDAGANEAGTNWTVKDNATTLITFTSIGTLVQHHVIDAALTEHNTEALWATNQASVSKTFASTILNLGLTSTNIRFFAHLRVASVGAAFIAGRPIRIRQAVKRASEF